MSVFLNFRARGLIKSVPVTPNELNLVQGNIVLLTLNEKKGKKARVQVMHYNVIDPR